MQVADSLLDLVGNTPLVRLRRVGAELTCDLVAKVELFNPGGSVKDRPAIAMIDEAERQGLLKPGGTIVEPTSGNTGVGLAIVAAQRGYRCVFVMSDKMSDEKVALLRAYGAEVVVCPTAVPPEHPDSYYSVADRLTREIPNAYRPNQYYNQANPDEHERSTGPEIWEPDGRARSRTSSPASGPAARSPASRGTSRRRTPRCRSSAPTPRARCSRAAPGGRTWSRASARTSGRRPTTRRSSTARSWSATPSRSRAARRVTREEGLLIGGSCGTAVHAALVVGRELGPEHVVVVLLPDSGRGYLSKIFNDEWMMRFGFLAPTARPRATCSQAKHAAAPTARLPELVLITPDEPAPRRLLAHARPRRLAAHRDREQGAARSRPRRCRARCPSSS